MKKNRIGLKAKPRDATQPSAFEVLLSGAFGGMGGAVAAHLLVTLLNRGLPGAETWFKGPFGPPFFNIALFMGVMYAAVSASLNRNLKGAALGFFGPFLGIVLPMTLLTHTVEWGMTSATAPTEAWYYAVMTIYLAATWGTIFGIGYLRPQGGRKWSGLGSALGAFAGYMVFSALIWAVPVLEERFWSPVALLPAPTLILDGLLTGGGMGVGALILWRYHEKIQTAKN